MQQSTFAEVGFDQYRKQTRRGRFLAEMEQVIPWDCKLPRQVDSSKLEFSSFRAA